MNNELDVAISSRIRLARNISGEKFPSISTLAQADAITDRVNKIINVYNDFTLLRMRDLGAGERRLLLEKHVASPELIASEKSALLLGNDETLSIMLNEEDHLRIQCILPGMALERADELTSALDAVLAKSLKYAFDPQFGYLLSCPTNLGTGMRASVMVHLPALSLTGYLSGILKSVSKLGYAVRGYYGEGSTTPGNIYQISNQVTLGVSEDDIVNNLNTTIHQVILKEREVRELIKGKSMDLEDRIFRSYGILKNARKLSFDELMEKVSDLKLGVSLGLINLEHELLHGLIAAQPFNPGQRAVEELDVARANTVRIALESAKKRANK